LSGKSSTQSLKDFSGQSFKDLLKSKLGLTEPIIDHIINCNLGKKDLLDILNSLGGGGGGGGGGRNNTLGEGGTPGGSGRRYGGGGGGGQAGSSGTGSSGGSGANGVIIIVYTPATAPAANGSFLTLF
jgi:hypothetical protein